MLQVENIHTYYGESHVLFDVSLHIDEGEIVTLMGRNGAGKTTTLRSIMGIQPPRKGKILYKDKDLTNLGTNIIANLGIAFIPEDRRIFPSLTVADNLKMGMLRNKDVDKKEAYKFVFELFPGVQDRMEQLGGSLSGGEQQMLAIARGLVSQADLLLIDEPTEGLMPKLVTKIINLLKQLHEEGYTILLVEQNAKAAFELLNRAYIIDKGIIQVKGTREELMESREMVEGYLGV